MKDLLQSQIGQGRFQWNAGAWFGSMTGSTIWMLVLAGFLSLHEQVLLALVPVSGFLIANGTALLLWWKRDRVEPFRAYISVFALLSMIIPLVWMVIETWGSRNALAQMDWPRSGASKVLVFLIVPVLMAWFIFLEHFSRSAVNRRADHAADSL